MWIKNWLFPHEDNGVSANLLQYYSERTFIYLCKSSVVYLRIKPWHEKDVPSFLSCNRESMLVSRFMKPHRSNSLSCNFVTHFPTQEESKYVCHKPNLEQLLIVIRCFERQSLGRCFCSCSVAQCSLAWFYKLSNSKLQTFIGLVHFSLVRDKRRCLVWSFAFLLAILSPLLLTT